MRGCVAPLPTGFVASFSAAALALVMVAGCTGGAESKAPKSDDGADKADAAEPKDEADGGDDGEARVPEKTIYGGPRMMSAGPEPEDPSPDGPDDPDEDPPPVDDEAGDDGSGEEEAVKPKKREAQKTIYGGPRQMDGGPKIQGRSPSDAPD